MIKRYVHTADAVFALILFCAFAVSMLLVLTAGAGAYQQVRDTVENHYSENTCVSYISMKLRHYNAEDIFFGDVGGERALFLRETFDGWEYITAIYYYGGCVRELYAAAEDIPLLAPEDGFAVVDARELEFSEADGLLRVRVVGSGGGAAETYIAVGGRVSA